MECLTLIPAKQITDGALVAGQRQRSNGWRQTMTWRYARTRNAGFLCEISLRPLYATTLFPRLPSIFGLSPFCPLYVTMLSPSIKDFVRFKVPVTTRYIRPAAAAYEQSGEAGDYLSAFKPSDECETNPYDTGVYALRALLNPQLSSRRPLYYADNPLEVFHFSFSIHTTPSWS
jgi:hypothetical protein